MDDDFTLRTAFESDKSQILSLLNNVFSEQERANSDRGEGLWYWKFQNSPYGKSLLTVVEHQGKIVGVANMWPWEFDYRGNIIKALQPCDSAIHPDFRGRGLFKKLRIHGVEYARESGYQLIFNFPNENSLPIYQSLGWHYLGKISWWVKILKPVNIIRGKLIDNKAEPFVLDDNYKKDISVLDSISSGAKSYDGYFKINRISGFHKWRYLDHPNRMYGVVTFTEKRKNTAVVFTVDQKGRNREMVVVDLLGSTNNIKQIFKLVNDTAKNLDVDFIAVMNNPRFNTKELWKIGYVKKKLKNMVVLPIDISLESKATSFSSWSLMASMHDSI